MLVVLETTSLDSDFDDKEDEVKLSTAELDSLTTLDSVAAELYELVSIDDVVGVFKSDSLSGADGPLVHGIKQTAGISLLGTGPS